MEIKYLCVCLRKRKRERESVCAYVRDGEGERGNELGTESESEENHQIQRQLLPLFHSRSPLLGEEALVTYDSVLPELVLVNSTRRPR
jgi:hypothetical protein